MALVRVYCGLASADPVTGTPAPTPMAVAVVDDAGRLLGTCQIVDDPQGYARLGAFLTSRSAGQTGGAVAVDNPDRLVTRLLAVGGWPLAAADSATIDDHAERFADDESAEERQFSTVQRRAVGLARALQAGALSVRPVAAPEALLPYRPLLAAHAALIAGRQGVAGTLREVLRELYPAALRAYPDPAEPVSLAVLDALPDPRLLAASGPLGRGDAADVVLGRSGGTTMDRAAVIAAVTALRVAVEETGRNGAADRPANAAMTDAVRQAVAAVRACDAACDVLIQALAEPATAGDTGPARTRSRMPAPATLPTRTRAARRAMEFADDPPPPPPSRTTVPRSTRRQTQTPPAAASASRGVPAPVSAPPAPVQPLAPVASGPPPVFPPLSPPAPAAHAPAPVSAPPLSRFPTTPLPPGALPTRSAGGHTPAGGTPVLPHQRSGSVDEPLPSVLSRSTWPVTADPDDRAITGGNGDHRPYSATTPTGLDDEVADRPGRVTPPWQADDLPMEPPTLRLVDPPPAQAARLTPPEPSYRPEPPPREEPRLGPPPLRLVDRDEPTPRAARPTAPVDDPLSAPVTVSQDDDLLIFSEIRSNWFLDGSDEERTDWSSEADSGWRAAEQAARPAVGARTTAGLPRRVPQANLVPGSALTAPERPLRIVRDAASIAAHTTGYFTGWRRGQEIGGYAIGGRPGRDSTTGWDFSRDGDANNPDEEPEYHYRSAGNHM